MSTEDAEIEQIRATFRRNALRDIAEDMGRLDAVWCIEHEHQAAVPAFIGEDAEARKAAWQKGYDDRMREHAERQSAPHP